MMNFFKSWVPTAFIVTILSMSSGSSAQEVCLHTTYTDWFPYTYQKNGAPSGFEIEIFKAVLAAMNLTATYERRPWERCLTNLRLGKSDILISMLKTRDREQYTDYPDEHISISKTVFFKKSGRPISFDGSYQGLKDYSIGVILGFSYGESFDQAGYLKKDPAINTKMLLSKLIKNRNDLAAENQAVVIATAFEMGVADEIESFGPPIHSQKLYVGFSKAKNLKKMAEQFSIRLREFKTSDQYQTILNKYGITFADMTDHPRLGEAE